MTSDDHAPPTVYAAVELPETEHGRQCECWTGEEPHRCEDDATHVFVYAASEREDDDRRRNLLACEDCVPQVSHRDPAADGGVPMVFVRLCELADADGDVPEDGSGIDDVWTRTITARARDRDWNVAVNGDTDADQQVTGFPRDDDSTTVPAAQAVVYLGAWPVSVLGPHGGEFGVEELEDGPQSVEDEFLRDVETALLDAGEDIDRTIPDEEVATDGGAELAEADSQTTHLRFAHRNVGLVLDGEEDATVRYGFERDLEAGDTVELLTPGGTVFALAEVGEVWTAPIRLAQPDMVFVDDRAHPATSPMDLFERLREHYPEEELLLTDEVTVIYFDVQQIGGESGGE